MSRSISIGYRLSDESDYVEIDVRPPYYLFGTQQTSMAFWSLDVWKEIGVTQLSELGHSDPICFADWEMMEDLAREIRLFQNNLARINFDTDLKSWFLAHLVYCHSLLLSTAPEKSIPDLSIG